MSFWKCVLGKRLVPYKNQKQIWKCLNSAEIGEETTEAQFQINFYQIQASKKEMEVER